MILHVGVVLSQVPKSGPGAPSIGTNTNGQRPRVFSASCEVVAGQISAFELQHEVFPLGGEGRELVAQFFGQVGEALGFGGGDVDG